MQIDTILKKIKKRRFIILLSIFVCLYTIILNVAVYLQYRAINNFQDFCDYLLVIWHTSRGNIFGHHAGWCGEIERMTFLGAHISPIILLFALIYRIISHPLILFIMQIVSVAITSIAIFYIAKERLKREIVAFAFGLSFLFYKPTISAVITSFQPEIFSIPLIAFSFLSLEKNRYRWCIFFIILLLCLKENMGFIVSTFGLYTFFRKNKKMGLCLFLLGLLWSIISIMVIIPHFREGRPPQSLLWFGNLGGDWPEIIRSLLLHPIITIKKGLAVNWKMKMGFQWDMLSPLLYLPLFSPELLFIAIPTIAQIYLTQHHLMSLAQFYYHASIDPILFISAIYGLERVSNRLIPHIRKYTIFGLSLIIIFINFYNVLNYFFTIRKYNEKFMTLGNPLYIPSERDGLAWKVTKEYSIPRDSSIATFFPYDQIFIQSKRCTLIWMYQQEFPEYIFLDALTNRYDNVTKELNVQLINDLLNDPWYELAFEKYGFYIFKRKAFLPSDEFLKELNDFSWKIYLN